MGEIQRALNVLAGTAVGSAFALSKSKKPAPAKPKASTQMYTPSFSYGSEVASQYAIMSANEAIRQKRMSSYSHVRRKITTNRKAGR